MPLSLNEIRKRATEFSKEWENVSDERAEAQSFWNNFFNVFGVSRKRVASFEKPVKKADGHQGFIDLLWKGIVLVEHKSKGKDLDTAYKQAKDYFPTLFGETRQPKNDYLVFPEVSSERRKYIPVGFMPKEVITIIVAFFLISSSLSATAQKVIQNQSFNSYQLFQELDKYDGRSLRFENCRFTHTAQDNITLWAFDDYTDDSSNGHRDLLPKKLINYTLEFKNCRFSEGTNMQVVFLGLYFNYPVLISNCTGYGVKFERCVFAGGLQTKDLAFRYLEFASNQFFESLTFADVSVIKVVVTDSKFIRNEYSAGFGIAFEGKDVFSDFLISRSEFLDHSTSAQQMENVDSLLHENSVVRFHSFDANHFLIHDCVFDCSLQFGNISVDRSFEYKNNTLYRKIIFEQAPNIPTESSTLKYSSIEGKIGSAYPIGDGVLRFNRYDNENEYLKDQIRPWIDTDVEKNIVPVYNKLLTIYDASADIESYNSCYNQMKKIEKTASKVKFETEHKIIYWFRWKMDNFLEYFNAYGTDPVLSLVNSFYWILGFAIIYILFPSEDDNLRFHNIRQAISRYVSHFSEQQKQFFTADEIYEKELVSIRTMKSEFHANIGKLPPIVSFIGMPFYYLGFLLTVIRHRIRSTVKFTIYQDWGEQTQWGRLKTSTIISFNFLGFLLWGIFMRAVNSFALSLNAFVTLGYGEIEAKGIARYFCVVEGMVGWFLLSIFSVSLISQILQ